MKSKIIVALDFASKEALTAWIGNISPELCRVKVGSELFTRCGPALIETLQKKGFEVFLDLKFHDIPNTVARACTLAADLGVWMVNVHISGGRKMLIGAKEALSRFARPPLLIGVTLLTSLSDADLAEIGIEGPLSEKASLLTKLAIETGLDGVVCSGHELSLLKRFSPPHFLFVVPGIRLPGDAKADQIRVMTPQEALNAGASYLVMGRSITCARNPAVLLQGLQQV